MYRKISTSFMIWDLIRTRDTRGTGSPWTALREKVPNVLSLCHTKRMMGPPFFWYDTDFPKCFSKKIIKSRCRTKRRAARPRAPVRTVGTFSRNAAHPGPYMLVSLPLMIITWAVPWNSIHYGIRDTIRCKQHRIFWPDDILFTLWGP